MYLIMDLFNRLKIIHKSLFKIIKSSFRLTDFYIYCEYKVILNLILCMYIGDRLFNVFHPHTRILINILINLTFNFKILTYYTLKILKN